jgi:3-hydroxyacyl-[acyl-carrier-protein] dehydratase
MLLEYFQMIDQVAALDTNEKRLVAHSTIPEESPIFEGHFPGHALMPGVLLIETMAQASGYLVLGLNKFSQMPFLVGVREAKLRSFVEPQTPITIEAHLEHDGSGFAMTRAAISHDGKKLCDARLTFKIMPFPAPELEAEMRRQATRIGLNHENAPT